MFLRASSVCVFVCVCVEASVWCFVLVFSISFSVGASFYFLLCLRVLVFFLILNVTATRPESICSMSEKSTTKKERSKTEMEHESQVHLKPVVQVVLWRTCGHPPVACCPLSVDGIYRLCVYFRLQTRRLRVRCFRGGGLFVVPCSILRVPCQCAFFLPGLRLVSVLCPQFFVQLLHREFPFGNESVSL